MATDADPRPPAPPHAVRGAGHGVRRGAARLERRPTRDARRSRSSIAATCIPTSHTVVGDFTSLLLVPLSRRREKAGSTAPARLRTSWAGASSIGPSPRSRCCAAWRERRRAAVSMPVVFTSALGVADDRAALSLPFGDYQGGLSQTPQVWLDNQVVEDRGRAAPELGRGGGAVPAGRAGRDVRRVSICWPGWATTLAGTPVPRCCRAAQRRCARA